MTITISHTAAQGTLVEGTARGDGSSQVLKTVINSHTGRSRAWQWSRNLGKWYVPRSRDARPNMALIEATETALKAAGFDVQTDIDESWRSTAEVEADAVARQERRVQGLDSKARRTAEVAAVAAQRAHDLSARMPLGQPILVDHHSAPAMTRAYEKIARASRTSAETSEIAANAAAKANAAKATTPSRYSAGVIRRRLDRLSADLRRWERARDGHTRTVFVDGNGVKHLETTSPAVGAYRDRALEEIRRLQDQITYWQAELDNAAAGGAQLWDATTVFVGDRIRFQSTRWAVVARVNAKTVSLESPSGRLPYGQIREVRTAADEVVTILNGKRVVDAPRDSRSSLDEGMLETRS